MTRFARVAQAVFSVSAAVATVGARPVAAEPVTARPIVAPVVLAGAQSPSVAGGVADLPLARRSTRPVVVGAIRTERASQVEVAGDRAYVLVNAPRPGWARVLVIDGSDPSGPTQIGATETLPLPARSIVAERSALPAGLPGEHHRLGLPRQPPGVRGGR